jgi:hypothetical protein
MSTCPECGRVIVTGVCQHENIVNIDLEISRVEMRPFRGAQSFSSPCIDCGSDVESRVMPVPERCNRCKNKWEKVNEKNNASS